MGNEYSCCNNKRQSPQPIDLESCISNQNQEETSKNQKWTNNRSSAQEIKKTKNEGNPKLSQSHYNAQSNLKRKKLGNFNSKVSQKRNCYEESKKQKKHNYTAEKQISKKDMMSKKTGKNSFCTFAKEETSNMESRTNNDFYKSCNTLNFSRQTSIMSTDIIYEEMIDESKKMRKRYTYKKFSSGAKHASTMYTKIDRKKAVCCNNAISKSFKLL
ncbi:unnamed protein product [Moneuplotes crassus]|uniref:Uncharacterized protein n=1 Tax=Euplotes crassus TaxID=5936 RepID=A0AAD2D9C3_EUPCR|nr:unnamed protein product [Moneuplotes crassus]